MEADGNSVEIHAFTSMLEISPETKLLSDESPETCDENASNKIFEDNGCNELSRDLYNGSGNLQKIEFLKKKSKSENVENILQETSNTDNSKKISRKETAQMASSRSPSTSSSEHDEIFQTRFSEKSKNILYKGQEHSNNNNNNPFSQTKNSVKKNIEYTDPKLKNISPIIIQATAYHKVNAITKDNSNLLKTIVDPNVEKSKNDLEKSKMEFDSIDSLSVEVGNSNSDIRHSAENDKFVDNEQTDYGGRKDSQKSKTNSVLEGVMEKIDSINQKYAKLNDEASDDFIVEDFLNGSLDLSMYRIDRQPSSNITKTPTTNVLFEKQKPAAVEKSTAVFENNLKKGTKNNFSQKENLKNRKSTTRMSLSSTSARTYKRRQSSKGAERGNKTQTQKTAKKRNTKNMNITSDSPMETNLNQNSIFDEVPILTRLRKKLNNQIFTHDENVTILNKFSKQNKAVYSKSKVKNSTPKKNAKNDKITETLFQTDSPVQHFTNNMHNSSSDAPRKTQNIKTLEKFINFEEISSDSGSKADVPLISGNADKNTSKNNSEIRNANKYIYETENSFDDIDIFSKKNVTSEEINSNESLQLFSIKENKDTGSAKNEFISILNDCNKLSKSPLKMGGNKKNYVKNKSHGLISDMILCDDNFIQESELHKNHSMKMNKRHSGSIKSNVSCRSLNISSKNAPRKETQSVVTYKGPVTRYRQKTWDMLEKELLQELDSETEMSQKKKSIKNSQDADLCSLPSTMIQTNRKSMKESKYNKQYELNTKSKYLEPKADSCKYSAFYNAQSKEIVPSHSKSISIIERSIAAMEKCNTDFCTSQINTSEDESEFHIEDISDYSNATHETLFHSNMMFTSKNEQYYKKEIIGYLKKSVRKDQSFHFNKDQEAEHLDENNFVTKSYSFKSLITGKNIDETGKETVPFPGKNYINPWDKLMNELNVDQDNESVGVKNISNNKETNTDLLNKPLVHKNELNRTLRTYDKRKSKIANFIQKEINLDEDNNTENENLILIENRKMLDDTFKSKNIDDSFYLTADAASKSESEHVEMPESEDDTEDENVQTPVKKFKKCGRRRRIQVAKNNPKFQMKIADNGSLKLKRYSSRSSSTTNSSGEFTPRQNSRKNGNKNEPLNNMENNKAKEKYKKYLKKVFDKEESALKNIRDDRDKTKLTKDKEENLVDKNINQGVKRIKLIAEKEDDVFSLSSSDSEACDEKNRGSGALCDLFDE